MRFLDSFLSFLCIGLLIGTIVSSCTHTYQRTVYVASNHTSNHKHYYSVALLSAMPGEKGFDRYTATGFAIDDKHLITAGHFCEQIVARSKVEKVSKKIEVNASTKEGEVYPDGEATIVAYVNEGYQDMCILKMDENHTLEPLEISALLDVVETEDPVTIVGAPHGYFPIKRDGYVWRVTDEYIALAIEVQPGNSGSPVIWEGKVIGMVIQTISYLNSAGKAVRSDHLLAFIQEHIKE